MAQSTYNLAVGSVLHHAVVAETAVANHVATLHRAPQAWTGLAACTDIAHRFVAVGSNLSPPREDEEKQRHSHSTISAITHNYSMNTTRLQAWPCRLGKQSYGGRHYNGC